MRCLSEKPFLIPAREIYVIRRKALWRHFDSCFRVLRRTRTFQRALLILPSLIMQQQRLHFRLFWRGKRNPATLLSASLNQTEREKRVLSWGSKTNTRRTSESRANSRAPRGIRNHFPCGTKRRWNTICHAVCVLKMANECSRSPRSKTNTRAQIVTHLHHSDCEIQWHSWQGSRLKRNESSLMEHSAGS
jgi:hypothetical protein